MQVLVNQYGRLVDKTIALGVGITNMGGRLPVFLDYDGDHRLDFVVTQYGGIAKLFHQNANGTFTETTTASKLLCSASYGQLFDVSATTGGWTSFVRTRTLFPQKIFDTTTFPWKKLFDSAPRPYSPSSRRWWTRSSPISTTTVAWTCSCSVACSCASSVVGRPQ
jgi:hypothetical protein